MLRLGCSGRWVQEGLPYLLSCPEVTVKERAFEMFSS